MENKKKQRGFTQEIINNTGYCRETVNKYLNDPESVNLRIKKNIDNFLKSIEK